MITGLKITNYDIPPRGSGQQDSHNTPIKCALYRGIYYWNDIEKKQGSYQGKVAFDVPRQCYWIWTGEYGRPPVRAGELLHVWISAWYHGKAIFPITIGFTKKIAEVECSDRKDFLAFWETE